ncbi:MAG: hypoxanthine phosphoribosyltransferase [Desulfuromonadales bacterium C00003068]|jgi:hypoxanthine phosphoribosyltransferase|nr:MAG: hypoxanthine phosphoribosyltransferase [Desulfuromonadales bacterium C00003068]
MKQLYTKQYIAQQVARLGIEIDRDYHNKEILMIVVLKGAMMFAADLAREIDRPLSMDFIQVSSYGGQTASSGEITFKKDIETDIYGKDILIVEDIIDTGLTLQILKQHLLKRKPASLKTCTLIDKQKHRCVPIESDYCGITMDDGFIVGYGLDYDELYRNLDAIYTFDPTQQLAQGDA